jgi:polysaccharide export outer membrane protein
MTLPALLVVVLASGACGNGQYVWVHDLARSETGGARTYRIVEGDVLDIRIYNHPDVSTKARVRRDGRITVPLIGDVDSRGKTTDALARDIGARLQRFIKGPPIVTVAIDDARPLSVTVLGEVDQPGVFTLAPDSGVLQALASAGGLTEFASRNEIFVVRRNPPLRIRFTYEALTQNEPSAVNFALQDGDVVTVE